MHDRLVHATDALFEQRYDTLTEVGRAHCSRAHPVADLRPLLLSASAKSRCQRVPNGGAPTVTRMSGPHHSCF